MTVDYQAKLERAARALVNGGKVTAKMENISGNAGDWRCDLQNAVNCEMYWLSDEEYAPEYRVYVTLCGDKVTAKCTVK